jgi:hypothetical protein
MINAYDLSEPDPKKRELASVSRKSPPGYVVDEDRATGWSPVRWQM